MKFGITLCLLVLTTWREIACLPVEVGEGNCNPYGNPVIPFGPCVLITCTKTKGGMPIYDYQHCPSVCIDLDDESSQSDHPHGPYPDCCPKEPKFIPGHKIMCP